MRQLRWYKVRVRTEGGAYIGTYDGNGYDESDVEVRAVCAGSTAVGLPLSELQADDPIPMGFRVRPPFFRVNSHG